LQFNGEYLKRRALPQAFKDAIKILRGHQSSVLVLSTAIRMLKLKP
jgi:hypothetical protein